MEIDEKKLKERKMKLQNEIELLQIQLQEAQQQLTQVPLHIASRKGEIIGINRLFAEKEAEQKKREKVKDGEKHDQKN